MSFPIELWQYVILDFMGLDSLNLMRLTSPRFRDMVKTKIQKGMLREQVEDWYAKRIPHFSQFSELLKLTRSVLSGSSIMSALMPEIPSNDIDVFVPDSDVFFKFLHGFHVKTCFSRV